MWTYKSKQIVIAINTNSVQCIQFDDGTEERGFNAIKSFKRGIFVNPSLDKKQYLSLLKVFHPDVSDLDTDLATQIAQAIISAKDGKAVFVEPQKSSYQSQSSRQSTTSSNDRSWWQQYNWSERATSNQAHTERQSNSHNQKAKEKDFETWLSYVPTQYWKIFGENQLLKEIQKLIFGFLNVIITAILIRS
jgi:hypothetical protein